MRAGMGLGLLAGALIAGLALLAWAHGLDGDLSFTIDDDTVQLHTLRGGWALIPALGCVVAFVVCVLLLPLGLLVALAVPLIVATAVCFGLLLPLTLVLALLAAPLLLVAMLLRWLWRHSTSHP